MFIESSCSGGLIKEKAVRKKMDLFSKLKEMKILLIDEEEWIKEGRRMVFNSKGISPVR